MSIVGTAALSHNQPVDEIYALPELLTPIWHKIEPFLPLHGKTIRPAPEGTRWQYYWKWQNIANAAELHRAFDATECATLEAVGPESFVFSVTPDALIWEPFCYHWRSFCEDGAVTERMRAICAHLAGILGADRVIYLPDNRLTVSRAYEMLCYEEATMDEATAWLRQNCGPPVQNVSSLLSDDEELLPCGYFVEYF